MQNLPIIASRFASLSHCCYLAAALFEATDVSLFSPLGAEEKLAGFLRAARTPDGDIPAEFWNVAAKSYYSMMEDIKDQVTGLREKIAL